MEAKLLATVGVGMLLAAAPGFAQRQLQATIPFDFTVGTVRMAAGDYVVMLGIPGVLRLASQDRKAGCVVITMTGPARKAPSQGKLVFHKYGETHFLAQVWSPDSDQPRQLYQSRREREYARRSPPPQLASVRLASR